MKFGTLEFSPVNRRLELIAAPVQEMVARLPNIDGVGVAEIDPTLSDTAAFCEKYEIGPELAANCVILRAKVNGGESSVQEVRYAACVILATTRTDVNGLMREKLGTKKISFAPMDEAVEGSGMEFGAITPVGLPAHWPIYIDKAVADAPHLIIGSGVRKSKLLVSGAFLAGLPNVQVLEGLGQPKA
jgi:prolyl-tRNA editing enzyme YbaK/EbsC (Cys-tRNA(Pro) deacylase)